MTRIIIIDNYDSFTFNLVQYLGELQLSQSVTCEVIRNDAASIDDVLARAPDGIILSPGPCTPNEAGICVALVQRASADLPILGVCLGHQAIAAAFGGKITPAPQIMHGKISAIHHDGSGIFTGLADPLKVARYHSLIVDAPSLPSCLNVTAKINDVIMGVAHESRPLYGVQFHPESIATQSGHALLKNFVEAL